MTTEAVVWTCIEELHLAGTGDATTLRAKLREARIHVSQALAERLWTAWGKAVDRAIDLRGQAALSTYQQSCEHARVEGFPF